MKEKWRKEGEGSGVARAHNQALNSPHLHDTKREEEPQDVVGRGICKEMQTNFQMHVVQTQVSPARAGLPWSGLRRIPNRVTSVQLEEEPSQLHRAG